MKADLLQDAPGVDAGTGRIALALFLVAAVLLVWRWLLGFIWVDQANCGLLAQAVLEGRWPIYVYGLHKMGALDGYIAAPLLALTGPSSLAWNFWPVFYYLMTMIAVYRALKLVHARAGVLVGLLYLAVPPAELMFQAGQSLTHYSLCLFIGSLIIWLTIAMWRAQRWPVWQTFLWGLLAGLGYWANTQTAVVIAPCGLFLALFGIRKIRFGNLLSGAVGLLLGLCPVIYYKLVYSHLDKPVILNPFGLDWLANNWPLFAFHAMPQVLGFNLIPQRAPAQSPWFWAYLVLAGLTVACMLLILWQARKKQGRYGLMLWGVVLCNIGVLLISWYGRNLEFNDFRYLLPLYLVLPFAWAAAADAFKAKWVPVALACLLLMVHLGGYGNYRGGFVLDQGGFYFNEEPKYRQAIDTLREAGIKGVYVKSSREWAFLSGGDPQFCQARSERRIFAASQVDAMETPAFMMPMSKELAFAGVRYGVLDVPQNIKLQYMGPAYHSMALPYAARHLLDTGSWRAAQGMETNPKTASLFDGDLTSGISIGGGPAVIDLGRDVEICAVALIPANFREIPQTVRVEILDAKGEVLMYRRWDSDIGPLYWSGPHLFNKYRYPRIEAHFQPVQARFVRISGLSGLYGDVPAAVKELAVWQPDDQKSGPSWSDSARLLLAPLGVEKVKRVYGDAWISAYLHQKAPGRYWTLMANYSTDNFGHTVPPPEQPVIIDPGPGAALAVETGQAEQAIRALRQWNCRFRGKPAGRMTLLLLDGMEQRRPLDIKTVTASMNAEAAASLAGGAKGWWSSGVPQQPGINLTLDLGQPSQIGALTLHNPGFLLDFPRKLRFLVSDDGETWQPTAAKLTGPLIMAGPLLAVDKGQRSQYVFDPPVTGRYLRLELDQSTPKFHWTVERLQLWAPLG